MADYFIIEAGTLGTVIVMGFIIHAIMFRHKAYYIKIDTDQFGKKIVTFCDGIKRYRPKIVDGKHKVQIAGSKELIPFSGSDINPSHKKNWGAVIVEYGDKLFFTDLKLEIKDQEKGIDLWMNPIPYDQRVNYAETIKALHKKFDINKMYIIAGGIVAFAMLMAFLMVYFTTDNLEGVIGVANKVANNVADNSDLIQNIIAPK